MGNAMKSTFGIGIVCISVLVLCTGAVPAGFGNQDNNVANESSDNCSTNYSECCCCSDCNCCCDCNESVAGETYETDGFDFHCYSKTNDSTPLKDIINHTANNYAIFWRGHDDNGNGTIDGTWNVTNAEGETYLHPIVVVLRLKNITHVYDFGDNFSGTPGEDAWAFKDEVSDNPSNSNGVPSEEFSSTDYDEIEADDGTSQNDQSTNNYAAHRFNFSIDETAPDKINVTWNGKGYHQNASATQGATLYIWNGTGYEELANNSDANWVYLTGENASAASNYVNGGNVTVLVVQNTKGGSGDNSRIMTDYVRVVITPDP